MIAEISTLIASTQTAVNIAKGLTSVYVDDKVKERTSELLSILLSVQGDALTMQSKHQDLLQLKNNIEQRMLEFENWSKMERQYELKDVAPHIFLYSYKKTDNDTTPHHYICPKCYQDRKTYILQLHYDGDSSTEYICNSCKNIFKIRHGGFSGSINRPRSSHGLAM
jgi:DNA-directed RNA polymerase subunit M/transcription elongation factor TFIIS